MKYGQTFHAQSVPQWAAFNVDYDELKHLIKANTTKDQGQAIAIPGQVDAKLAEFEKAFLRELSNQHDRVDLFVMSKADEIGRRLQHLQKVVLRLLARSNRSNDDTIPEKRRNRFAKYNAQIERCGDDIRSLQRFVAAQRVAFHKIVKKYTKWTGSKSLGEHFNSEVLGNPKSFLRRDFNPMLSEYQDLSTNLRSATPTLSEYTPSPSSSRRNSRRPSTQMQTSTKPQRYWNEYDDGSEAEADEPYTIYVDSEAASYPGAKIIEFVYSNVKQPMRTVKGWFSPHGSPEHRPLLTSRSGSYFNEQQSSASTDVDDETSSNEFPAGYATHYAVFPSIKDQKLSRSREAHLFRAMLVAFAAALVLIVIVGILVATGRRKLKAEVDAGAVLGCAASLLFDLGGLTTTLCRKETLSWLHRSCVGVTFLGILALNMMLLVLVLSNIRG